MRVEAPLGAAYISREPQNSPRQAELSPFALNSNNFYKNKLEMFRGILRRPALDVIADLDVFPDLAIGNLDRELLTYHPIYRGVGVERGDGSTFVIVPGLFGTPEFYRPLKECLVNIGYEAEIYPPSGGINIYSAKDDADHYMEFLSQFQDAHILAHSIAGALNAYVSEVYHDDYCKSVNHLTALAFGIPQRNGVNGIVGTGYILTRLFSISDEFEVMEVLRSAQHNLAQENGFEVSSYDPEHDSVMPKSEVFGPVKKHTIVKGARHTGLPFMPEVISDIVQKKAKMSVVATA